MSFFSKLFHKEEKVEPKADPNVIELPCGKFFFAGDDPVEVGYEAEIDWYEKTDDLHYQPVGVFIETDVPGAKDASLGLERFTRLYDDRDNADFKVKLAVTEHYLGDEDSIVNDFGNTVSRDEFLKELEIRFISVYRSGKRVYSLRFPWVREKKGDVHIIFDEDDKTTVLEDQDYYRDFMSLIYPEQSN